MTGNPSKRYMLYLDNDPKDSFSPDKSWTILSKARGLFDTKEIIIRDLRIANKFLEFDISMSEQIDINDIIESMKNISSFKEIVKVEEHLDYDKEGLIKKAIILFNEEKYWWAHEKLENVWKKSFGDEKILLNGIILIAAAFVHFQKDENDVCLSILNRAFNKLRNFEGKYYGIDIDRINDIVNNDILSKKKIFLFRI
ncbi:MAG: DUF309 domain-containing protein [Nitrososphaeraceae archaeon]|nr:DUF309 domain-containing protein [Nitrososphaeraceae archaeon]